MELEHNVEELQEILNRIITSALTRTPFKISVYGPNIYDTPCYFAI